MIPLKSVSTFARTIEATDRVVPSSGTPSWARRRSASAELSPPWLCAAFHRSHPYRMREGEGEPPARDGLIRIGSRTRWLPRSASTSATGVSALEGDDAVTGQGRGGGRPRLGLVAESYGSDVVSVLSWLAPQTSTIKLGAAVCRCPPARPQRLPWPGDDRQALRRPLHLRLRPLRPPGLRGLVRGPLREALGSHPRVHRGGPRDHRPRGAPRPRRAPLQAAAAGEARPARRALSSASMLRNEIPCSSAIGLVRSRWRPRSATAGSIFFSADAFEETWGEHLAKGFEKGGRSRSTSRSTPPSRSRSTAIPRPLATSSRRACSSTSVGWEAARPTSSTSPALRLRGGRAQRAVLFLDSRHRAGALSATNPEELVGATSLIGTEAEVAESASSLLQLVRRRRSHHRLARTPRPG